MAALPKGGLVEIEAVAVVGLNTAGTVHDFSSPEPTQHSQH